MYLYYVHVDVYCFMELCDSSACDLMCTERSLYAYTIKQTNGPFLAIAQERMLGNVLTVFTTCTCAGAHGVVRAGVNVLIIVFTTVCYSISSACV